MGKIAKSDVVQGGRNEIPTRLYRVRCIGTKFGKSGKGHDMTTLDIEIIDPEFVNINGQEYRVTGRQAKMWLLHVPGETWGQGRVFGFMDKLGIQYGEEYDTDLHKEYFMGMEWDMVLSSEETLARHPKQPGEKEGAPILDGEGKPISSGFQIDADIELVPANCRPSKTELPF
jgi:hypothetical protein